MFSGRNGLLLRVIFTGAIGICSIIGDQGLKYGKPALIRAVSDNVTHATVGGLTWALVLILSKKSLTQNLSSILLCFCLSSFVDIDHFLAARSWHMNDATHLKGRPFLHCTTIPIVTWVMLLLISNFFNYPKLGDYSWIILASFLSHHIRDGTRRGLWFCPVGSTKPIPYYLYLNLCMVLPYLLQWGMMFMQPHSMSDNLSAINIV